MLITTQLNPGDPPYPVMEGKSPAAKEFNRRMKQAWGTMAGEKINVFEVITTILLELFVDEYNKRHAPKRKKDNP